MMDKVASNFHTTLARESYCNSGMERHYAGDDYWDEVAKCVSIGLHVDQTCAILVFLTYQ